MVLGSKSPGRERAGKGPADNGHPSAHAICCLPPMGSVNGSIALSGTRAPVSSGQAYFETPGRTRRFVVVAARRARPSAPSARTRRRNAPREGT